MSFGGRQSTPGGAPPKAAVGGKPTTRPARASTPGGPPSASSSFSSRGRRTGGLGSPPESVRGSASSSFASRGGTSGSLAKATSRQSTIGGSSEGPPSARAVSTSSSFASKPGTVKPSTSASFRKAGTTSSTPFSQSSSLQGAAGRKSTPPSSNQPDDASAKVPQPGRRPSLQGGASVGSRAGITTTASTRAVTSSSSSFSGSGAAASRGGTLTGSGSGALLARRQSSGKATSQAAAAVVNENPVVSREGSGVAVGGSPGAVAAASAGTKVSAANSISSNASPVDKLDTLGSSGGLQLKSVSSVERKSVPLAAVQSSAVGGEAVAPPAVSGSRRTIEVERSASEELSSREGTSERNSTARKGSTASASRSSRGAESLGRRESRLGSSGSHKLSLASGSGRGVEEAANKGLLSSLDDEDVDLDIATPRLKGMNSSGAVERVESSAAESGYTAEAVGERQSTGAAIASVGDDGASEQDGAGPHPAAQKGQTPLGEHEVVSIDDDEDDLEPELKMAVSGGVGRSSRSATEEQHAEEQTQPRRMSSEASKSVEKVGSSSSVGGVKESETADALSLQEKKLSLEFDDDDDDDDGGPEKRGETVSSREDSFDDSERRDEVRSMRSSSHEGAAAASRKKRADSALSSKTKDGESEDGDDEWMDQLGTGVQLLNDEERRAKLRLPIGRLTLGSLGNSPQRRSTQTGGTPRRTLRSARTQPLTSHRAALLSERRTHRNLVALQPKSAAAVVMVKPHAPELDLLTEADAFRGIDQRDNMPIGQFTNYKLDADETCVISNTAILKGNIKMGPRCIVHPTVQIDASKGPVVFGEGCVFEEQAHIITGEEGMKVGNFNFFEIGCKVIDVTEVGNMNSFGIKCLVEGPLTIPSGVSVGTAALLRQKTPARHSALYGVKTTSAPRPQHQVDGFLSTLDSYITSAGSQLKKSQAVMQLPREG